MTYYLLLFIVKLISYIPFKGLYALSDLLFFPVYYIVRYRRVIIRKNLTESFPDKDLEEIITIEKKFYHFLIDMILESCKVASISQQEIKSRIKFTNIEVINDILSEGKSVTAFMGHYGNWEWISTVGLWLYKEAVGVQVYHRLSNKAVDKLMLKMRKRSGCTCVEMRKTARCAANAAKGNIPYAFGLIADQSPRKKDIKHYVQFLNHEVPVLVGPEKLTKHHGFAALFLKTRRVKRGYYECELSVLHNDPASLPDYKLSDLYFQRLEEEILEQPELYLWSHNRFRLARKTHNTSQ